jgi:nicotinamidase-related amidase
LLFVLFLAFGVAVAAFLSYKLYIRWYVRNVEIGEKVVVAGKLRLNARHYVAEDKKFFPTHSLLEWDVAETAILLIDVWDDIYCKSSRDRIDALIPKMNEVISAARGNGVMIIHAPSEVANYYHGLIPRIRMQRAKPATPPIPILDWDRFDSKREAPFPIDDSKDKEPCDDPIVGPPIPKYSKIHNGIRISDWDGIAGSGREVYNFCSQEGIKNIAVMGFYSNLCVLGRSYGIRQLVKLGFNVVLVRDMTDAMYDPRDFPFVSHTQGCDLVIEHIEKYWCPTIEHKDLLGVIPGSAGPMESLLKYPIQ